MEKCNDCDFYRSYKQCKKENNNIEIEEDEFLCNVKNEFFDIIDDEVCNEFYRGIE